MRTTVELPPELFRRAKARAAASGETLKELFERALAAELGDTGDTRGRRQVPVQLPLIKSRLKAPRKLRSADLARLLADEEVRLVRSDRASKT
jgi:hypothetical protein